MLDGPASPTVGNATGIEMPATSALPVMQTDEDDVYQIWLMRYARGPNRRAPENFMLRDIHDGPMPIDYNLWRNARRTVLVDTGFSARAEKERNRERDFDPLDGLKAIGIDPDGLEDMHYDHAGNLDRFAKARFHVQDAEAAYATGRCMCEQLSRWPFDVEDVVTLVRRIYAERVVFHDGDAAPFPGITLHYLPGHSKGVQAVKVTTERGPVLLASDVSHYYANFLRMAPFILTIDSIQTLRAYRKLMELTGGDVQRIIPGHDPKVRRFYPKHEVGGIELLALHEQPIPHTAAELKRLDDF